MKFRKQQSPQADPTEFTAKARLRNFGNGTLELVCSTMKFYVQKGRLKKQKQIAKEIPIGEIESIELVENELSICWKGVTDRFVIEKADLAETLRTKITEASESQRKTVEAKQEVLRQKPNEIAQALGSAIKTAGSLFDILRSLHGRIDWSRAETHLKRLKESISAPDDQRSGAELNILKLSSAIKEHRPEEISREAFGALRTLFEYFNGLTSQGEPAAQTHPNNDDAKKVLLAYYTMNDIILGNAVGDEEVKKEINELEMMLDDLSKVTGLQISVDLIKAAINKLDAETDRESVVDNSRVVFMQQLKELVAQ